MAKLDSDSIRSLAWARTKRTTVVVAAALVLGSVFMPGSAVADTTPPATPTGLVAAPGDTTVTLDWADNTEPDFNGYDIYRDGDWLGYSWESRYTDTGLINGQEHYYAYRRWTTRST